MSGALVAGILFSSIISDIEESNSKKNSNVKQWDLDSNEINAYINIIKHAKPEDIYTSFKNFKFAVARNEYLVDVNFKNKVVEYKRLSNRIYGCNVSSKQETTIKTIDNLLYNTYISKEEYFLILRYILGISLKTEIEKGGIQ